MGLRRKGEAVTITLANSGRIGVAKYFVDQYGGNPSTVSFGQALVSYATTDGWWQYAAWYAPNNAVMLARRNPLGEWSSIALPFGLRANDSHNSINLGVSRLDGTLHIAAGQHNDLIQYTRSYVGFLDDGAAATWLPSAFEPMTGDLLGTAIGVTTYPTFTGKPDGGLLFWYRNGGPGAGRMRLAEYDGAWALVGDVTSSSGSWTAPNNGAVSTSRNFYWAHPVYDGDRLHLAGTWREGNSAVLQVPTAPIAQHHIVYVYSDDHGRTWFNTAGAQVGATGTDPFGVNDAVHVPNATTDTRYAIQVSDICVGPNGLIGILPDYVSPDLLTNSPKHVVSMSQRSDLAGEHPRWYDVTSGVWDAVTVKIGTTHVFNRYPPGRFAATRGKLTFGPSGDMHVLFSGVRVCSASAPNYDDWRVVEAGQNYFYAFGEFQVDRSRPGRVSVLYIEQAPTGDTSCAVRVRDFLLEV